MYAPPLSIANSSVLFDLQDLANRGVSLVAIVVIVPARTSAFSTILSRFWNMLRSSTANDAACIHDTSSALIPLPRSTAKASLCLPLAFGPSGIFTIAWVLLVHLKSKRVLAECIDGKRDRSDWWLFKDHGEWVTLSISRA